MKIKKFNQLNESVNKPIKEKKLIEYANAIKILCAGEYGDVYYNEEDKKIWICLGDSHPFDEKFLKDFMKDYISNNYDDRKHIEIIIENEILPPSKEYGWKKITKNIY